MTSRKSTPRRTSLACSALATAALAALALAAPASSLAAPAIPHSLVQAARSTAPKPNADGDYAAIVIAPPSGGGTEPTLAGGGFFRFAGGPDTIDGLRFYVNGKYGLEVVRCPGQHDVGQEFSAKCVSPHADEHWTVTGSHAFDSPVLVAGTLSLDGADQLMWLGPLPWPLPVPPARA